MARSAVLNIIFGAETGQLDRALGGVQKRLRRTAGEFQRLGDSMSRSVSLPIIGLGAAAVKSASDLETLETSFISLAGGANEAAQLVNQLNEFTAKTPFQLEAVGNAARQLIAAGTGVDEVNQQLQFLGDIAATSGSSIDEIAAIFSKVQAKGKVELESLNQLAERGIPIFTALSEATGLPASELGAGAVSLDQFNETLASFAEEGGFAAGAMQRLSQTAAGKFSTALDNLKLAGAELGAELLPLIKDLLDQVVEVAQSFSRLDSGTKKLIIRLAAFAAAMGPVSKGIGGVLNGVADLRTGFKGLAKQAPKLVGLLTNPWVLVGAAVVAAGIAVYDYTKSVDEAAIVQDRLQNAQEETRKGYIREEAEVSSLLKQYKFYEGDLENRKAILEKLNSISPTYFGNLDAEKASYEDLTSAATAYTDAIRQQAIQKAFGEELIEVETRRLQLAEELREKEVALADAEAALGGALRTTAIGVREGNDQRLVAGQRVNSLQREVANLKGELAGEAKAYDELQAKIDRANKASAEATAKTAETDTAVASHTATVYGVGEGYKEWTERTGFLLFNLEKLSQAIGTVNAQTIAPQQIDTGIDRPDGLLMEDGRATLDLSGRIEQEERLTSALERQALVTQALQEVTGQMAGQFEAAFASIASGADSPAEAMRSLALGVIDSAVAAASAAAIQAAAQGSLASGPLAPVVLPVLIGAMTGLIRGALSTIPALAQGGLATGPTLAMVGDNASGKEAIIPFERMGEFMKMAGGGQSQQVVVTGRISGKDIVLSNQRGSRDRSRVK